MREKRFSWDGDILFDNKEIKELGNCLYARDICDLLNELADNNEQLKHELCLKEDRIQQLKISLCTDDRKEFLRYRKKFVDVCEDLADMNQDYQKLSDELNDYKQKVSDLINQKITDVEERKGYLFKSNEADAIIGVLNELKEELHD